MNRIKPGFLAECDTPLVDEWATDQECGLKAHEWTTHWGNGQKANHSVFLPVHLERRYRYALLIWFHGDGENANQLSEIMPRISDRNYIGVAIQETRESFNAGPAWSQTSSAIENATRQVQHAIRSVQKNHNIDSGRVFIAGSGSGGTMAFRMAFRQPRLFLGAASFNGAVPGNLQPLLNVRQSREVPLFWGHRRNSEALPEPVLCQQLKLLYVAGFDVTLRQYPGNDAMADPACSDLNRWMMERISDEQNSSIVL